MLVVVNTNETEKEFIQTGHFIFGPDYHNYNYQIILSLCKIISIK